MSRSYNMSTHYYSTNSSDVTHSHARFLPHSLRAHLIATRSSLLGTLKSFQQ